MSTKPVSLLNAYPFGEMLTPKSSTVMAKKAAAEHSNADIGEPFLAAVQDFVAARDLSIFAIMTTSTTSEGQFQRQLFLQAKEPAIEAAELFGHEAAAELGLESLNIEGIPEEKASYRRVWQLEDVSKSRKQVSPLIRQAMNS